jgi:peptide/nickel transport system substrate-binding protein
MRTRLLFTLVSLLLLGVFAVQAQDTLYNEAPMLAAQVANGELPPVNERLPVTPLVVTPYEQVGVYGGTWRRGIRGGSDDANLIRTVGYEPLIRWTPDWSGLTAGVAESWEGSDDATQFTFRLREGMRWSDGEPFTTSDIMFWYEDVILNPEITPAPPSWMMAQGQVGVVEAQDDYTFTVTFAAPNGLFLQRLATPDGTYITQLARHYYEQFLPQYNPDGIDALIAEAGVSDYVALFEAKGGRLFGTARWANPDAPRLEAWIITEPYTGNAQQVVLTRNPYYWKVDTEGNQLPYLDQMVFTVYADVNAIVLAGLAGELDMQERHINALTNKPLFADNQEAGDYHFFELIPASSNTMVIDLNLTHRDPVLREILNNRDFRIGLSYAINRQEIIDTVFVGQGTPSQVAPQQGTPFYNEQLATQYTEYNVDLANAALDSAGLTEKDAGGFRLRPDGQRLTLAIEAASAFPEQIDALLLIQRYWRAVGVDVQVLVEDRSLFYERKNANEPDASVFTTEGGLNPILDPRHYFPFSVETNWGIPWANYWLGQPGGEEPPAPVQEMQSLYEQLVATPDLDGQIALMNQILQISADGFYTIGISTPVPLYGIVRNNFHNVPPSMPATFVYPNPGPTNPEQYFIDPNS